MSGVARINMPNAKAWRDRQIHSQAVRCPTCDAQPGSNCVSANGKPVAHPTRRRMAIRAMRLAGVEMNNNLRVVQQISPRDRVLIRKRAGMTRQQVADQISSNYGQVRKWELGNQPTCAAGVRYADLLIELRSKEAVA